MRLWPRCALSLWEEGLPLCDALAARRVPPLGRPWRPGRPEQPKPKLADQLVPTGGMTALLSSREPRTAACATRSRQIAPRSRPRRSAAWTKAAACSSLNTSHTPGEGEGEGESEGEGEREGEREG